MHTCFHVDTGSTKFLIDCGASSLAGIRRLGIDVNEIDTIFISHLHGDHFAGLVWLRMFMEFVTKRKAPLTLVGPPGIEQRVRAAAEALFPGTMAMRTSYEIGFVELAREVRTMVGEVAVTAFEVSHPSGAPSYALRVEAGGRVLSYSGDTEWVESLIKVADGADMMLIECYGYATTVPYHMSWKIVEPHLPRLKARWIVLTHMNAEMLANQAKASNARVLFADDGLVLDV
ncbi:MAG: MBL fold metallo-hydrolase [Hyphomicrobiaceae bacterium]|nr:MAG: MBL fold metallo-hydrolase [Hyphomicrobiaceae bacterium]